MDKSVHIKTALGIKGSLMVGCFPPISPHYKETPQRTLKIFSQSDLDENLTDHVT